MDGSEGYEPIPTGDIIPLTTGAEFNMVSIPSRESCTHLPEDQLEDAGHHPPELSPTLETGWVTSRNHSRADGSPDIHGIQLLMSPDFHLILAITLLCKFSEPTSVAATSDDI